MNYEKNNIKINYNDSDNYGIGMQRFFGFIT